MKFWNFAVAPRHHLTHCRFRWRLALSLAALFGGLLSAPGAPLRLGTFRCDLTPPPGEPLIWATRLVETLSPLLAKGVVIEDGNDRYVLCSLDWCLLGNDTELSFRRSLAAGARTTADRVAIQCVHQHAAPYADEAAHRLIDGAPQPLLHLGDRFLDQARARLEQGTRDALQQARSFDRIGTGQANVAGVASARRLYGKDGKPVTRYSTGARSRDMAEAPEGDIDPVLRTVTFAQGNQPLARLHYYATHPQTFCCDGRASSDFVGAARELVEREDGVPQIYFTGCSGDVTVGKYNDGSVRAYDALTAALAAGLRASIRATEFASATGLVWRTAQVFLPLRADRVEVRAQCLAWLENPKQPDGLRVYEGAMRLAYLERLERPLQLSSLQLGSVWIVHLPGEPMLEFQRYAQRFKPGDFVAVAGYGDGGPAYICTDQAIAEGGYEPGASNVGRGSESRLKQAIRQLLGAPPEPTHFPTPTR